MNALLGKTNFMRLANDAAACARWAAALGGSSIQIQEADMNEDIKAAFEKVAKEYDAREDAAKKQRDQELTERQQFEAGYQQ
jgi:hypothetical protein